MFNVNTFMNFYHNILKILLHLPYINMFIYLDLENNILKIYYKMYHHKYHQYL